MKKFYSLFIALIISFGLYAETTATAPTQGDGSSANTYQIENLAHLRWLSETSTEWNKHFIQTANIDAAETTTWNNGKGFTPIGIDYDNSFTGTYNGNYHKIENLTINRPESDNIGLFGYALRARVEKLIVENCNIAGRNSVGGIIGSATCTVYQTSVSGTINGAYSVGGIVGYSYYATIEESFSNVIISSDNITGIGGITGTISSSATIKNCYSISSIYANGYSYSGGIIGEYPGMSLSAPNQFINNYFAGTFRGESKNTGGIIGWGNIPDDCFGNLWDSETSEEMKESKAGISKTTAEMKDVNTFLDALWDFKFKNAINSGVWNIGNGRNNGYPYLTWQYPNDEGIDIEKMPIVRTVKIKTTSENKAEITFAVDYVGNPIATEFGICYGLNKNPDIDDTKIISSESISEGEFTFSISGLENDKNYYLRAYAINDIGTAYSEEIPYLISTGQKPAGKGEEESPYLISNFYELLWISKNPDSWDKHFIQIADIDASVSIGLDNGKGFTPIGIDYDNSFAGTYNGNYHKIENLTINRPKDYNVGLFGYISNSTIEKTQLENVNITGYENVGGVCGLANEESKVYQTSVTGDISGTLRIGGICGNIQNYVIIEENYSNATISGEREIGGIIGVTNYNSQIAIINNYSLSNVSSIYIPNAGVLGNNNSSGILYHKDIILINNYNAGEKFLRGIVGGGEITEVDIGNFWDVGVNNKTDNIGAGGGKSSAEMKDVTTFVEAGWKFKLKNSNDDGVWNIGNGRNNGYPYLNWQYPDDPVVNTETKGYVSTKKVFLKSYTEAEVTLEVEYIGTPIATEFGICYGFDEEPSINDNKIAFDEDIKHDEFTTLIDNLEKDKTYYFRAYIKNTKGVLYGNSIKALTFGYFKPDGYGTEENPYQIAQLSNLLWLSENEGAWNKHFIQTADIDASETQNLDDGKGFKPIGNPYSEPFTGTYNGNYHKIKNLYINRPDEDDIGLFSELSIARVEKLSLEEVDFTGNYTVGGIAGRVLKSSIIYQTSVTGKLESKSWYIGGISGQLSLSRIYESCSDAIIIAYGEAVGGIVGNSYGRIISCYSLSSFLFKDDWYPKYAGGIAGTEEKDITNCYYAGPGEVGHGISRFYDSKEKNTTNFWDSETSGVTRESVMGISKTTAEMKDPYLYFDRQWDLKIKNYESEGIWNIGNGRNNGYPYLSWQYPDDEGVDIYIEPKTNIYDIKLYSNTEAIATLEILDIGNEQVLEYGICYGFKESPTIDDNKIPLTENIKNGATTLFRFEIEDEKLYYVRGYIIDNIGIYYSDNSYIASITEKEPNGNGSTENPYQISQLNELLWLTNNPESWDKHIVQIDDIDASPTKGFNDNRGFNTIGDSLNYFTGVYNGNYHKIENLYFSDKERDNAGFFGTVKQAKIEKLILDSLVIVGHKNVGGIVGFADESHIFQTKTSGKIYGEGNIGGLIGHNLSSNIEESFSTSSIYADSLNAGGLVGYNELGNIKNSYVISYPLCI